MFAVLDLQLRLCAGFSGAIISGVNIGRCLSDLAGSIVWRLFLSDRHHGRKRLGFFFTASQHIVRAALATSRLTVAVAPSRTRTAL